MAFQGIYLTYILTYLFSDILPNLLSDIYSAILSGILSGTYSSILCGICSGILSNIFGDSLWSRSGRDHYDPGLAVRARRGPLRSRACSWGPAGTALIRGLRSRACSWGSAGNTLILGLLFGSSRDHCHRELPVEVRRRKRRRRRRRRRRRPADIKSNNPHPGGEKSNNICGLPWWQSNCNVTSFVSTIS